MAEQEIVIVGAGPAGMRAAETLVQAGLRPMVVDEAPASGGQIYRRPPAGFVRGPKRLYGTEAGKAVALHRSFDELRDRIDYRPGTLAWGLTGNRLFLNKGDAAEEVPFRQILLAAGATDRVLPIPGWNLPGVFTLGAAQIALKAQGTAVGSPVIFLGSGPLLFLVANQYLEVGANVAAVLDTARFADRLRALPWLAARPRVLARGARMRRALIRSGVPLCEGIRPEAIRGDVDGVSAVVWRDGAGRRREVTGTAVAMGWHLRPEVQLAELAGCDMEFDPLMRHWRPAADPMGRSSREGVYLAGDGAKILGADGAELAGRLAAMAILEDLGKAPDHAARRALLRRRARAARFAEGVWRAFPLPDDLCASLPDDTILCRCEAVSVGSFRSAVAMVDACELNRAKAISRVGMGRCQGRYCSVAAAEIMCRQRGVPLPACGRLRPQAPIRPLSASVRSDGKAGDRSPGMRIVP